MSALPAAEWTAALDRMTAALGRSLADLDRYNREWTAVTDAPPTATPPEFINELLERRLGDWDARLTAASDLAATVEAQIADRAAAVVRWHEVFVRWRELIEQTTDPADLSAE